MISVEAALAQLFSLVQPMPVEEIALRDAATRVLRAPVVADRAQPPFDSAAMDGYAVASAAPGDRFKLIGESAAGKRFSGSIKLDEAVRIFTGAPVPDGARRIVIQEDATRDGDSITISPALGAGTHIRPAGGDFGIGAQITAPTRLRPVDLALIAAMNVPTVTVSRKPTVAILSTGSELVVPGEAVGPDQIVSSNAVALAAMLSAAGAIPRILPIAQDTRAALENAFALAHGADLILTIGGASVGDHDLVMPVAQALGFEQAFHKVAMRPGKPLLSGRLDGSMLIGLPGNPVSSIVCGQVFVLPVINAMLGLAPRAAPRLTAPLAADLAENGPREHYMRAAFDGAGLRVAERQDSSLLSVLAGADALVVRPPHDPARSAGETVEYLPLSV